MTTLEGMEEQVSDWFSRSTKKEAKSIADKVVPQYRLSGKDYTCTGTIAKKWQAAYEGACMAFGVTP